ncbi:hypothetical protein ACQEVB_04445 [Pseudonocardia sp. CA-107938]
MLDVVELDVELLELDPVAAGVELFEPSDDELELESPAATVLPPLRLSVR